MSLESLTYIPPIFPSWNEIKICDVSNIDNSRRYRAIIFGAKTLNHVKLVLLIDMSIAFVLINTDMGSEAGVSQELEKIEEVKVVYGVYGVYDLVVRIEAETLQELKDAISNKIRTLDNVRSTLTMIVV